MFILNTAELAALASKFGVKLYAFAVNYVLLAEDFSLNFPRYNMSNYGRRAFCFAGPYVWNSLPEHIRQSTSIAAFKHSSRYRT